MRMQSWWTRNGQRLMIALVMMCSFALFVHAMTRLYTSFIDGRKLTARYVVEVAHRILETHHALERAGKLTREDAQRNSLLAIRELRYGDNEYFWVNDMHPRMLSHPVNPELENQDLSEIRDEAGKRLFVEFVKVVKTSGSGYVTYLWPKPGQREAVSKVSYVKGFEPWGWVIGSGIYTDDIDAEFRADFVQNILLLLVMATLLAVLAHKTRKSLVAEQALRVNEARLAKIVEKLPVAAVVTSGERTFLVNERFTELFGFDAADIAMVDDWWPRVFPDAPQREKANHGWWQQVSDTLAANGARVSREYQMTTKSGAVREVEVSYCQADEWAVIAFYDMTERKAAEAYQRLTTKVYETTGEAIMVTDIEARIVAVNPAFSRITGYSLAEVVGRNPNLLNSGRHAKSFYRTMWQTLKDSGEWKGEIWNRRKNGEVFPEWQTLSAVRDEQGHTTHYIAVFADISEVRRAQELAERLSWRDGVTGLANRALFLQRLEQKLISARREEGCAAVLLLDIDRFTTINEARGAELGDALLRAVATAFSDTLRADDMLARLGADEFAVLLPRLLADIELAGRASLAVAEQLRQCLSKHIAVDDEVFHLDASIGVAVFPQNREETVADLMRQADMAMHRAKDQGGGRTVFFETAMGESVVERYRLENELRQAVAQGELRLYLQSQVDANGRVVGAEALVRWQHPQRGLVPPGMFIPLAESSDLIVAIDRWVLDEVCRLLARLESLAAPLRISVNISPRHFQKEDFVSDIKRHLAATGAEPARLVLEITEGLVIGDFADVVAKMTELTTLGIHFSMDDFGTGYSSLAYLKRLPIQELKIDKSFVSDVPGDANDVALVETILAVARHLNLSVVAEGVETQAQADFLNSRGDVIHQGYLYGRPLPVDTWLDQRRPHPEPGETGATQHPR